MGQSTDELRRDIEVTRDDMSGTLDAIGDRLIPGRVAQRQKNRMSATVRSWRDRVMGTASDMEHGLSSATGDAADAVKQTPQMVTEKTQGSPMMAGAVAMGVGFLAAVAFPATEKERRAAESVKDTIEPARQQVMDSAKEVAQHMKEPAREAAEEIKQAASQGATEVASTAREAAQDTKQQAQESAQNARSESST